MVIADCRRAIIGVLSESEVFSPSFEADEIIKEITGRNRPIFPDTEVTDEQYEKMLDIAAKRADGVPLQYIFGEWEFYGLPFKVGEGVLIPRPETELLVDIALEHCGRNSAFLDLCSGSGCIPIAVSKCSGCSAHAVELSEKAFSYLEENVRLNGADVTAVLADALDGTLFPDRKFDVITSNPPYLTAEEMSELEENVRHEPEMALYGGEDGLDFYRRLIPTWKPHLAENGIMAFEVGDKQAEAVAAIAAENGMKSEIVQDLQKIGRVVICGQE